MTFTIVGWLGTALQILGATCLAFRWLRPGKAYLLMLPGAAIWLGLALAADNWSLAAMQGFFCALNTVGLWRWRT